MSERGVFGVCWTGLGRVVAEGGTGWVGGAWDADYTWVKRIVGFGSGDGGAGGGVRRRGVGHMGCQVEVGDGFSVFVVGMFEFEIIVPN